MTQDKTPIIQLSPEAIEAAGKLSERMNAEAQAKQEEALKKMAAALMPIFESALGDTQELELAIEAKLSPDLLAEKRDIDEGLKDLKANDLDLQDNPELRQRFVELQSNPDYIAASQSAMTQVYGDDIFEELLGAAIPENGGPDIS